MEEVNKRDGRRHQNTNKIIGKKKYFICNEFLQLSETLAARETLLLNGVLNQKLLFKRLENVAVGPMSSEIYCVKISFKYPEN